MPDFEQIVISGFHCFDCVEKLAKKIQNENGNVLIDTDLTEMFSGACKQTGWDKKVFDPDLKLLSFFELDDNPPVFMLKTLKERYSNPIWGISKKILKRIDFLIHANNENEEQKNG